MEKYQLFCIPYAGGNADLFSNLENALDGSIKVTPIEYSGHGKRSGLEFYNTFDEMVKDVAKSINSRIDAENIAVFGYSMGSVVAFEILLQKLLIKEPVRLFIASHEAPGTHWESMEYNALDDTEFLKKIVEFGGIDRFNERMLNNKFFRKMIFNPIRADYKLISQYKLTSTKKLDIKATMFYSENDVSFNSAEKWQDRFINKIDFYEMGDNHFFIKEHYNDIAKIIFDTLKQQ
ncbi:MAG: thioesterase II family protein [Eubacterium sp.]